MPVPIYKNKIHAGFRKDKDGNTVITKLNENALQEISAAGNGMYVRAGSNEFGLKLLLEKINKMEKKTYDAKIYTDYEDRFPLFIAGTLFLLVIESFISDRKNKWWEKIINPKS